jgi:glycerol-3-phosphate acyltransferase PlsY
MLRTGRKGLAAVTLVLDFIKGVIGIAVAQGLCNYFFMYQGGDIRIAPSIRCLAGTAAVFGHVFPVWLGFKGGKGVATTLGVLIAIHPLIGILTAMGWLMLFYLTRISSLAAIGSIAGAPVLSVMNHAKTDFTIMAFVLAALVLYKHKENIRRLRDGTETKWVKKDDSA